MAARVIFGVGGFVLVLLALFVFPPIALELALVALCVLATYEILGPTKLAKDANILYTSVLASLLFSLGHLRAFGIAENALLLITGTLALLLLFGRLLRHHDTIDCAQALCGFFGALILPYFLLSLMRIFQMEQGQYLVLLPLLAAWGSDTFAYFFGRLLGRHKLAPVVSPKKTIEGAVGGVLGGAACLFVFALILDMTLGFALPYWAAALLGAAGAVIGQIGDLSFSIIKRQTGIKDYGHIFPGHGGVLDRFDSVIFVAPVVEAVLLVCVK